jgi:hypothetical protein
MDKPLRSVIHLEAINLRSEEVKELDVIAEQLRTRGAVTLWDLQGPKQRYEKKPPQP